MKFLIQMTALTSTGVHRLTPIFSNLTMEEMRRSCVNDLVFGFAKMGESSQIAMCLSKNKEQAHKRQFTAVLDGINIVDASVAGIEGSITDIGGNVITVDTSRGFLVLWPGIEA